MMEDNRRRLKELRTLRGWEVAYKSAGLPNDNAKDNTKQKRLSRLISRKTGGYKKLSPKQQKKIEKVYNQPTTQKAIGKERGKRVAKEVDKQRKQNRSRANKVYGAKGTAPNKQKLAVARRKNKTLTDEEKQRIETTFQEATISKDFKRFRASYHTVLKSIDTSAMDTATKAKFASKLKKSADAVIRDGGNPNEL